MRVREVGREAGNAWWVAVVAVGMLMVGRVDRICRIQALVFNGVASRRTQHEIRHFHDVCESEGASWRRRRRRASGQVRAR